MKKKGFTLIELLAVIIIIAVISIITVPTILGVIDKSRKAAYKDSIYGIIDSARIYLTMNQENIKPREEIEFVCNGISCSRENNGDKLEFKGEIPKSGSIYLYGDGNVLIESVYNGKYYANNETGEVVITEDDTTFTRGELTKIVKDLQAKYSNLKTENDSMKSEIANLKNNTTSIDKVYPVGSIYISTSNVNPENLFRGTTWERYAENRTLLGTSGTAEQIGGNSSITLAVGQLPSHNHGFTATGTVSSTFTGTAVTSGNNNVSHTHSFSATTSKTGSHIHQWKGIRSQANVVDGSYKFALFGTDPVTLDGTSGPLAAGDHTHTVSGTTSVNNASHVHAVTAAGTVDSTFTGTAGTTENTGSGSAINIMNPYITVYMWKRVS